MKPAAFPEIETERLKLIQPDERHLQDLFEIYSDEESMEYWDSYPQQNMEDAKKLLGIFADRYTKGTALDWVIVLKEEGAAPKVIGTISYNRYAENGLGVIGYILNTKYRHQGLMAEAARAFIQFGFEQLKLHKIEAHVMPGNDTSEKLLIKLGFMKEGLLREREFFKGRHQSFYVYGKLVTDDGPQYFDIE
jgi:ribosomal-protein-alanine N-acetyltransferase